MRRIDNGIKEKFTGDDASNRERGFVLITSLVLISVLTILGVGAAYKTLVEIKVSKLSADSAKALQVANTGINQLFWYWVNTPTPGNAGYDELLQLKDDIANDTTNSGIYIDTLTGGSVAELETAAGGDLNAYIKTHNSVRVYEYQYSNGIPTGIQSVNNSTWGSGKVPQVAVWATSYDVPATDNGYPYASPNTGTCDTCNIVVYAVGRIGDSRRLVRQTQGFPQQELNGVSALTNAPNGYTWDQMICGSTVSAPNNQGWSGNNSGVDTLVEATQADYVLGTTPSGRSMVSNSLAGANSGGGSISSAAASSTLLNMGSTPLIAYAGHGAGTSTSRLRVDLANTTMSTTGSSLPSGELPKNLVEDRLIGGNGELVFFTEPTKHLFQMDAYRWAAEQFTCQAANSTNSGNGAYCARADALRNLVAPNSTNPVTGRLSLADFEYNVANGIPMFGIVRVLYPAEASNQSETCNGQNFTYYQLPSGATQIASGNGHFTQYGASSKLIVYGSIFFDYFADTDGDYNFDANAEHLLTAPEARKINLPINVPVMINPAMPSAATGSIPTVAAQVAPVNSTNDLTTASFVNSNSSNADSTLASPYDGWFLGSEGLVDASATGTMALMSTGASGLVGAADEIKTNGSGIGTKAGTLFTNNSSRLFYYYRMMYGALNHSDANVWPATQLSSFSSALSSTNFAMGADDSSDGSNDGDKFHLLFPSGYLHGWKVALAALNMTADEWNNLLSGNGGTSIVTLATNHNTPVAYGDGTYPLGSPLSDSDLPAGYSSQQAWATQLQGDQQRYFKITKDSTTGYGLLDSSFADVPALAFSGGVASFQTNNNISGIVYMPGALQWQNGKPGGGLGYVNGSVITGMGVNNDNSGNGGSAGHVVFVFDPTAVDNAYMRQPTLVMRRHAWEELY